jgi:3-aminobutyryl-CoA ammonia-lyase
VLQVTNSLEGLIRLRMSGADAHYAGGLVDGARILQLFGDAVTELLIRHDGDEGLSRVMTSEFLAPVRSGDYLEIRAKIVAVGKSSRTIECTAHKIIELVHPDDSAANVLAEPVLVAKATDVAVVPLEKQRRRD